MIECGKLKETREREREVQREAKEVRKRNQTADNLSRNWIFQIQLSECGLHIVRSDLKPHSFLKFKVWIASRSNLLNYSVNSIYSKPFRTAPERLNESWAHFNCALITIAPQMYHSQKDISKVKLVNYFLAFLIIRLIVAGVHDDF